MTAMLLFHRHIFIVFSFLVCFLPVLGMAEEISNKGWVVQLNSFREQRNAESFIRGIKKKGYTPFVVKSQNSKWFKVRIGPYPSKLEALQVVGDLKKKQGISALVVLSSEGPLEMQDPIDSIDVVVSQFLIWVKVWEAGDINAYLSFYAKNFTGQKRNHQEWVAKRRYSLSRNSGVHVQVSDIQMKQNGATVAMTFVQNFKSDRISDTGSKELVWRNDGDGWKIIKETWEPR